MKEKNSKRKTQRTVKLRIRDVFSFQQLIENDKETWSGGTEEMAFTRIKQEKNSADVEAARAKLNIALQNVIDKKNESPSSSDDDSNRDGSTAEVAVKSEPVSVTSTMTMKRQPQRTQRKRRRKDDSSMRNSNTYVMKLFDRAVDLSPFSEDTPLYPICRAWINNQPHQTSNEASDEERVKDEIPSADGENFDKIPDDQGSRDVYMLPLPMTYAKEHPKDLRIPSPIPAPEEEFVVCSDVVSAPPKEVLMKKHMERWKAVRQKWKRAAQINEDRYRRSGRILKAIFERSERRDDFDSADSWEWRQ